MTTGSAKPLWKVFNGALAAAICAVVLSLIKHYLWVDMPADLEGPMNTIILALVVAGASGITGYMTPLAPAEVVAIKATPVETPQL